MMRPQRRRNRLATLAGVWCAALLLALTAAACGGGGAGGETGGSNASASGSGASAGRSDAPAGGSDAPASEASAEQPSAGTEGEPIAIGDISTVSGEAAQYGEQIRAGEDLAVEMINANGGVNGRPLEITHKDNAADKAESLALFRQFAADEETVAILGPNTSTDSIATTPLANELEIVQVVTGGAAPWPVPFGDWVFRVPAENEVILSELVADTVDAFGIESAAIIYASDQDYSVAAHELFAAAAEENGVEIKAVETFRAGDVDYASQITSIKNADVDAVFMSAVADNAGPLLRQAGNLGLTDVKWICDAGCQNPAFWDLSAGTAQGVVTGTPFDPTSDREVVTTFVEEFRAKNGSEPTLYNALGYDSVQLLAAALSSAPETTRTAVREAMAEIEGFEGVTGVLSFPEGSGSAARESIFLVEMQDGEFVSFNP